MKQSVIILHGWGLNGSKYNQLKKILENKNNAVYAPDMPGFGKEVLESANMDLDDYVLFLERFIKKKKIESPVLIGHSFGGRVAIKYTYKYPDQVSKLILTGVPVIRHINSRQKLAIVLAKIGGSASSFLPKTVFNKLRKMPYYLAGSFDYYKAGPMSKIFVSIIS
ncbi:MAG: alpha/beta hydrolase, partial [Patescibacteria group bacterium]|nr:alpha/beta hydrolase [Patescibacteria group bacterium]